MLKEINEHSCMKHLWLRKCLTYKKKRNNSECQWWRRQLKSKEDRTSPYVVIPNPQHQHHKGASSKPINIMSTIIIKIISRRCCCVPWACVRPNAVDLLQRHNDSHEPRRTRVSLPAVPRHSIATRRKSTQRTHPKLLLRKHSSGIEFTVPSIELSIIWRRSSPVWHMSQRRLGVVRTKDTVAWSTATTSANSKSIMCVHSSARFRGRTGRRHRVGQGDNRTTVRTRSPFAQSIPIPAPIS